MLTPLVKFENAVQLRDFSLRARLSCQSSINRLFTSTDPNATEDLFLTLRVLGPITRAESCRGPKFRIRDSPARHHGSFQEPTGEQELLQRVPSVRQEFPVEEFQ